MKPNYRTNNTNPALIIISLMAIGGLLSAWMIGPSEKPALEAIAISTQAVSADSDPSTKPSEPASELGQAQTSTKKYAAADTDPEQTPADSSTQNSADSPKTKEVSGEVSSTDDTASGDGEKNKLGSAVGAAAATSANVELAAHINAKRSAAAAANPASSSTGATGSASQSPAPEPLAVPEPTPELAPAVTPETGTGSGEDTESPTPDSAVLPAMVAGTATGAFFTKNFEADGAEVSENTLVISFEEDGSGTFRGKLEMAYENDTAVTMDMSGVLEWTANNPQVDNVLAGTYKRTYSDGRVDDSDEATLKITSLESGSGALCTTECFGLTFSKN